MADKQKVTVNLSADAVQALQDIADSRGVTLTEALRQAIATERFLSEEVKLGNKILVERPDQGIREIILR
jgi:predicted transcriptional regulator